jgi:hypothetical protein
MTDIAWTERSNTLGLLPHGDRTMEFHQDGWSLYAVQVEPHKTRFDREVEAFWLIVFPPGRLVSTVCHEFAPGITLSNVMKDCERAFDKMRSWL